MVEIDFLMHMVVSMEGEKAKCFEDKSNPIHKIIWNCIVSLLLWCKQLCIEDTIQSVTMLHETLV